MGEYITKKEDMKFQSQEALVPVQNVIDEAGKVLNDPSLRVEDSAISGAITGALGAGAGGALGFAGLYFGGTVTGLSAAGITSGLAAAGGLIGGGARRSGGSCCHTGDSWSRNWSGLRGGKASRSKRTGISECPKKANGYLGSTGI